MLAEKKDSRVGNQEVTEDGSLRHIVHRPTLLPRPP
jgi:hypothetical protein